MTKKRGAPRAAHLEVEKKFRISAAEFESLVAKITKLGFRLDTVGVITDTLLAHTSKVTHRVRRCQIVSENPSRVIFEETRKTRNSNGGKLEEERTIDPDEADLLVSMAIQSQCDLLPSYSKRRCEYVKGHKLPWRWRLLFRYGVKVVLDRAEGLGRYSGHYVEIECLVPLKDKQKVPRIGKRILKFAQVLLGDARKPHISYARMLLASRRISCKSRCA